MTRLLDLFAKWEARILKSAFVAWAVEVSVGVIDRKRTAELDDMATNLLATQAKMDQRTIRSVIARWQSTAVSRCWVNWIMRVRREKDTQVDASVVKLTSDFAAQSEQLELMKAKVHEMEHLTTKQRLVAEQEMQQVQAQAANQERRAAREKEELEALTDEVRQRAKQEKQQIEEKAADDRQRSEAKIVEERERAEAEIAEGRRKAQDEIDEALVEASYDRRREQEELAELKEASGPLIELGLLPGVTAADAHRDGMDFDGESSPQGRLELDCQTLQEAIQSCLLMAAQSSGGNAKAKTARWSTTIAQTAPGCLRIDLHHEGVQPSSDLFLETRKHKNDLAMEEASRAAEIAGLREALAQTKFALDEARTRAGTRAVSAQATPAMP